MDPIEAIYARRAAIAALIVGKPHQAVVPIARAARVVSSWLR